MINPTKMFIHQNSKKFNWRWSFSFIILYFLKQVIVSFKFAFENNGFFYSNKINWCHQQTWLVLKVVIQKKSHFYKILKEVVLNLTPLVHHIWYVMNELSQSCYLYVFFISNINIIIKIITEIIMIIITIILNIVLLVCPIVFKSWQIFSVYSVMFEFLY